MKRIKKISTMQMAQMSLALNMIYALYNVGLGVFGGSWWYLTLAAYYVVLSVMRFCVVLTSRKKVKNGVSDEFVMRFTGFMFMFLSVVLAGTTYLSMRSDQGIRYHEIVMITIALYSFIKITYAIVRLVQSKKEHSISLKTLRNISFADALVSIFSLQRSMLVSFDGMTQSDIAVFNSLTGSAVYILVFVLGLNLIGGKKVDMAKSKIVKSNEKIASTVVSGYKAIENGVVKGYKKIEDGVVKGYTKVEDKFVDRYLTKDGETVEQAKERLKKNK